MDDDGNPIPNEMYRITLPDGSVQEGNLDDNGYARLDGIEAGSCDVEFPNIDASEWQLAEND